MTIKCNINVEIQSRTIQYICPFCNFTHSEQHIKISLFNALLLVYSFYTYFTFIWDSNIKLLVMFIIGRMGPWVQTLSQYALLILVHTYSIHHLLFLAMLQHPILNELLHFHCNVFTKSGPSSVQVKHSNEWFFGNFTYS